MITLDGYGTLVAASFVLLVGRRLLHGIKFLRAYSIPEPVAGGLIAALGLYASKLLFNFEVRFDTALNTPLMLAFFASIGLNANLASLKRGGRPLLLLFAVVIAFLITQNFVGVTLAHLLGFPSQIGLLAGSISLSGGHGTGAAWGSVFSEKYGLTSAPEVAIACATFGLILGGLIGGPVASYLAHKIKDQAPHLTTEQLGAFEAPGTTRLITAPAMIEALALFAVCLLIGNEISRALKGSSLELPAFVCVLFVGVILRNILSKFGGYEVFERCNSVLGNVSLALFLAMALMSLRLWELTSLALPMFILLGAQTLLMVAWAIFITFRVMGANHDAIVIAAGHCGFGLGATPTAIANMQAVSEQRGHSQLAFLIVPMVGAFFIDIANAVVIKLFLFALT
ncbi:sodium/glutamate symporter [uncultured Dechloromonas sp.]|uniref:sodium/glutamate symporter n=1 Tax=uncultured Dechloromonas sp. TaxID=171719 RepID=UPI0025DAA52F|nr:sodium/glutamate symporter [uncultured Dechloromonas sp.]